MGTTATPEPNTTQEAQSTAEPNTQPSAEPKAQPRIQSKKATNEGGAPAVDKYAEARLAKKKQRRRAHRKTISRPNTSG